MRVYKKLYDEVLKESISKRVYNEDIQRARVYQEVILTGSQKKYFKDGIQ